VVLGLYFYDRQVFDFISSIGPSPRGELEITDVNNLYIAKKQLEYDIYPGRWMDAGTPESWFAANRMFLEEG
jgi:glucose-1-phosphate thymidylyltransferase